MDSTKEPVVKIIITLTHNGYLLETQIDMFYTGDRYVARSPDEISAVVREIEATHGRAPSKFNQLKQAVNR